MAEVCTQGVDTGFVALGYAKVAALGVVQGITELLPISSTAHMRIVPALLGWQDPGSAFSAAMQLAALVAVVNHRHGTPDWMPIQLKLRDDLDEAIAAYKHYDVLLVNAMFDGMNLVAKEGPLVNEVNGVLILSETAGAFEQLGAHALAVAG